MAGKTRRDAGMQAAGTQAEHEGLGAATRLRLLSLTTPAGPVEFGGALACIRAASDMRNAIAEAIALAVIGPRHPEVDGTLEIAGRFVALQSLPAPLLLPSAASTVDRSLLDEFGRRGRAQRRADVQAEHAARRLERHRTEAEIERAHGHAESLAARIATAAEAAPPDTEAEAEVIAPDEATPRLVALLESLRELHPVPSADALAVADALEKLAATAPSAPEPVDVDLVALEHQVVEARAAVAHVPAGVSRAARARIEECQRAVVETERALFEAARDERPGALFQYQEALTAVRAELTEAGVTSYASFLVAVGDRSAPADLEARVRAERELAQAEAALDHARVLLDRIPDDSPGDEELQLRVRAAQILGHLPGADPVAELRALRVDHPAAADLRRSLQRELEALGVHVGRDIVTTAQSTIDARLTAPPPEAPRPEPQAPASVVDPKEEEQRALEAEMQALLEERAAHDAALAALESELDALDRQAAPASEHVHADAVALALTAMLDSYRSADLLAGRLPVVLDGAFDEIGAYASRAVADHLVAVDDVQVIVITSDDDVVDAFSSVGAATSSWPDPDNDAPAMCDRHAATVAVAWCAHCTGGACLDCLVYMPAEADLWCVTCAEGARNTKAPVPGNRAEG